MKPDRQMIVIAEVCGWKRRAHGMWSRSPKLLDIHEFPPNYLNDLNAMHEAEKVLSPYQLLHMKGRLSQQNIEPMTATAKQRAEAFLKTIGKWEEGE